MEECVTEDLSEPELECPTWKLTWGMIENKRGILFLLGTTFFIVSEELIKNHAIACPVIML